MRPIIMKDGIVRFRENVLVRALLAEAQKRGFGLNELVGVSATQEDQEQFAQLIGYSLSGYHELSYVSDEAALAASKVAADAGFPPSGCRDDGCEIHLGVEKESP